MEFSEEALLEVHTTDNQDNTCEAIENPQIPTHHRDIDCSLAVLKTLYLCPVEHQEVYLQVYTPCSAGLTDQKVHNQS